MATPNERKEFLEKDLYDALRWLFVGAVTWQAAQVRPERCPNQPALGMYTNLVQARALYEFFYNTMRGKPYDAWAHHFASSWVQQRPRSPLYDKYMATQKPANKRIFHLVYERSQSRNAGWTGHDGPDHLKNQVVRFAKDLRKITEAFVKCVKPQFRGIAKAALDNALNEAKNIADKYGIANPV